MGKPSHSGEFDRIAEIRRRLGSGGPGVLVDNGDDAAVLAATGHASVLSVDAQVEGVHFRRDLLAPSDIGYRALCAALSDLAAMGSKPRAALIALIAPADLPDATLFAIADGVAEATREHGCPVVGGNLAAGSELSLTTTVIGEAASRLLTRAAARAGDGLFVAGELGLAALGLRALFAGKSELAPIAVARWRRPCIQLTAGRAIAAIASAAIDVSDGLLQDLGHLAQQSGVGFEIELAKLPLSPELREPAALLGLDAVQLALCGGEDYALLFTAPAGVTPPIGARIGHATAVRGVRALGPDGREVPLPERAGFDHFAPIPGSQQHKR